MNGANHLKKIIITGAASGIGFSLVKTFVREGYGIIAVDMDEERLAELPKSDLIQPECLSVTNHEKIQCLFESLKEDDQLFGLVNNAGIYYGKSLLDYSETEIDQLLSVNIKGATYFSKYFIQHLQDVESKGKIINLSSISGQEGSSDALYGLSKAALLGLTKSLALRFSEHVLVNAIAPTMVETEMMSSIPDWRKQEYYQHHLIKEPLRPEVIAETALFLMSANGDHYTGATFDLNNGGYLR